MAAEPTGVGKIIGKKEGRVGDGWSARAYGAITLPQRKTIHDDFAGRRMNNLNQEIGFALNCA